MIIAKTRKWGNSLGVIIPKELVEEMNIKPNEDIWIDIKRKNVNVLKELYGARKYSKKTSQDKCGAGCYPHGNGQVEKPPNGLPPTIAPVHLRFRYRLPTWNSVRARSSFLRFLEYTAPVRP